MLNFSTMLANDLDAIEQVNCSGLHEISEKSLHTLLAGLILAAHKKLKVILLSDIHLSN